MRHVRAAARYDWWSRWPAASNGCLAKVNSLCTHAHKHTHTLINEVATAVGLPAAITFVILGCGSAPVTPPDPAPPSLRGLTSQPRATCSHRVVMESCWRPSLDVSLVLQQVLLLCLLHQHLSRIDEFSSSLCDTAVIVVCELLKYRMSVISLGCFCMIFFFICSTSIDKMFRLKCKKKGKKRKKYLPILLGFLQNTLWLHTARHAEGRDRGDLAVSESSAPLAAHQSVKSA